MTVRNPPLAYSDGMANRANAARNRVIGYVRVSTAEQALSGLGLQDQEATIRAEVERRGWELVGVLADEGATGKNLDRPGLLAALRKITAGEADVLMAAKIDRLSRSVPDFADLMAWCIDAGAELVVIDPGVDTSTPSGRLVATVISAVAEWEADIIAQRTGAALHALRAQGKPISRPAAADNPALRDRIFAMREAGMTFRAIADTLNDEGLPTLRGGAEWRVSSVQNAAGYRRPKPKRRRTDLPDPRRRSRSRTG